MGEAEREQQQPGHREVCSDRADRDLANFKLSLCLCSHCRAQAGTESRKHQAAGDKGMFTSRAVANLQREDLCEDIRYIFRVWGDLFDSFALLRAGRVDPQRDTGNISASPWLYQQSSSVLSS